MENNLPAAIEDLSNSVNNLPPTINNLVQEYKSATTYITNIQTKNKLLRDQTILEELSGVDLDDIIQFKLARQLAHNLITSNGYKIYMISLVRRRNVTRISRPDPKILTGIFYDLLDLYSYEALSDIAEDQLVIPEGFEMLETPVYSIMDYIYEIILTRENIVRDIFNDPQERDYLVGLLDQKIQDEYNQVFKYNSEGKIDALVKAYHKMITENRSLYTTLPLVNYIELYSKYLLVEIKKAEEEQEEI